MKNGKNILGVLIVTFILLLEIQSNAQTWTWINKANLLKQGRSFGVAVINEKIYVAGGYCGPNCNLSTLDEYNPVSNTWTNKANMLSERYAPVAAELHGKLYVMGGANGNGILATVEEYDPLNNTWTNKASMNQIRYAHRAVTLNGKIYAVGGQTTGDIPLASIEEYDPSSNTWTFKADMPVPRVSFGAAVLNGKIYVIGGKNNEMLGGIAPVYSYDPSLNSWATNASIPTLRESLATVVVNGRILALGGHPLDGGCCESLAVIEEFDSSFNTWSGKPNIPTARNECFAVTIKDTLFVFGGYDNFTMNAASISPLLNIYTAIELEIFTETNKVYQVQATTDLFSWTNFDSVIQGNGQFWTKTYSTRGTDKQFYRVQETTP